MNYSHVQFISWELYSGPTTGYNPNIKNPSDLIGFYPGISLSNNNQMDVLSQCHDAAVRIKFAEQALLAASQASNLDARPSTLKVFMAPEFVFRGAGGAYLHDLINGWSGSAPPDFNLGGTPFAQKWGGLFGGLQALANDNRFKDWIIVFGTAISASFATKLDPMPRTSTTKAVIDWTKPAEIYNTALVQLGGVGNTAVNYASRKHYKSPIDFLKYYIGYNNAFLKDHTVPLDSNTIALVNEDEPEGSAFFNLQNVNDGSGKLINFGLEICLDHAVSGGFNAATRRYRNSYGRLRNAGKYAKVQLVPSAGMSLEAASIRLEPAGGSTPNSYAFNCDGLNNLSPAGSGCHTQIWNGANGAPVPMANKLFEASGGAALGNTTVQTVAGQVTTSLGPVAATTLWTQGAGRTRVINTLPL